MQGCKRKEEPVFHYFQMHKLVPDGHILKLVDKHVDFSFVRARVSHLYSEKGRPSIDPVLMVKMLLVGYLFGIASERKLCDEVGMHVGYRWFVGLNMDDKVPDHSTFSKNRHGRFSDSAVWEELFEEVVRRCIAAGLVCGEHLSADGTYVEANASMANMQKVEVGMTPKKYLEKVAHESAKPDNSHAGSEAGAGKEKTKKKATQKKLSNDTHRSLTDPDALLGKKSGSPFGLYHEVGYVMDNASGVILDAQVGRPNPNTETDQALDGLDRAKWCFKLGVKTLGLDRGYRDADFLAEVLSRGVTPHVPIRDMMRLNADLRGILPREKFTCDPSNDCFICPQGKTMKYRGMSTKKQKAYRASAKDCGVCPMKAACTRDKSRTVSIHRNNDAIETTKKQMGTRAYRISQKKRKRIEALFGEAKEQMGFRRMKFRGRETAAEQVLLTATAQNIKRLVKHLERLVLKPVSENRAINKQTANGSKTALSAFLSALLTILRPKTRGLRICLLFSYPYSRNQLFFNSLERGNPF